MSGLASTGVPAVFVTTHWSVVLSAGRSDAPDAQEALTRLCQTYWPPLYAYVRRRGKSPHDAQDLTQEFFARLLEHNWVQSADQEKGRFRTFLLTAMNRFMAGEWDRARAQKRGGGATVLPLDTTIAENQYAASASNADPARLFDRQWAMTLLERCLAQLAAEHQRPGKTAEFEVLRPFLIADRGEIPYAQLAVKLASTEVAARMAIHRLRKRFREVFRQEIAQTVATPDEVDGEIRHLLAALVR